MGKLTKVFLQSYGGFFSFCKGFPAFPKMALYTFGVGELACCLLRLDMDVDFDIADVHVVEHPEMSAGFNLNLLDDQCFCKLRTSKRRLWGFNQIPHTFSQRC